jgi:hypothetical protein
MLYKLKTSNSEKNYIKNKTKENKTNTLFFLTGGKSILNE